MIIHQEPSELWAAVYAPMVFTLTSTNSSQSQFNFVCDVYYWLNGVKTFLGRLRAPAIEGVGMFDISGLLASTFNPIPSFGSGFEDCVSFYNRYACDFYEEYDTTGGLGNPVIIEESLVERITQYCWVASDNSLAELSGSAEMKVLLNNPRDRSQVASDKIGVQVRMDERVSLMWKKPQTGAIPRRLRLITYKKDGTQLLSYTFPDGGVGLSQTSIWSVGVSPLQLNEWASSFPVDFTFPPINGSVDYYTVQLVTNIGQPASELVRFNIDRSESKLPSRRVHWLNRFGGIDSMSFKYSPEFTADRDTFKIGDGFLEGTVYDVKYTKASLIQTATTKTSAEFTSNCLTERGYNSLKGLAASPRIWISEPRRVWKAINQGKPAVSMPGDPPIHAQLCDDDFDSINRGDESLINAFPVWYWIQNKPVPYSQSSGWATIDETDTPTSGGFIDMTDVPADSCIYEMHFNHRQLARIAPTSLVWTRPKDNLRQLTFKADLPSENTQWR